MIVKNEARVIQRCLASVRPIFDYWIIVDTGSTDNTMEIIRETLKDVPGELHQHPWVNFGHNRTEALQYALHGPDGKPRCDYTLFVDADDEVVFDDGFVMPRLESDSYLMQIVDPGVVYYSKRVVRSALPWRYEGPLHAVSVCELARTEEILHGIRQVRHFDGGRAGDPKGRRRDALLLEKALIDEPENERYVYYLAQTYRDAGDLQRALLHYQRRAQMNGWSDETWSARYEGAKLKERLGNPWEEVLSSYLAAYQFLPDRAEPLYRIGTHYQSSREYALTHLYLGRARQIPFPQGHRLFVENEIYDYLVDLNYAVACYWLGLHAEAIAINDALLNSGCLPPHLVDQVVKNRQFSVEALAK